jgi:hypothetical protein
MACWKSGLLKIKSELRTLQSPAESATPTRCVYRMEGFYSPDFASAA